MTVSEKEYSRLDNESKQLRAENERLEAAVAEAWAKVEENCRIAKSQTDRLRAQRGEAVEALKSIRDIEKPMVGDQPATDWLSWYTTSSQQSEIAGNALNTLITGEQTTGGADG